MTLSWCMDKIGPIARSIEDFALVFDAIHGADGLDAAAVDRPFSWPPCRDRRPFKVGYIEPARWSRTATSSRSSATSASS